MREIRSLILAVVVLPLCVACSSAASAEDPTGGGGNAGSGGLGGEGGGGGTPSAGRPTVYYVIRHAERDPGVDPPLNDEGVVRAQRLADSLEQAGVDEIIATEFIRTQQTGQPLSDRTSAPITVAPFEMSSWTAFAEQIAIWQREREVPGTTYLMIGHSGGYNTTLLEGLGAPPTGTLAEEYQDLVILMRESDGSVRLSVLQYGGQSSLDPI
jgi:phosphohistidine phosphatase SixA